MILFNFNKLRIKYQSCPKSRKLGTFGQKRMQCHSLGVEKCTPFKFSVLGLKKKKDVISCPSFVTKDIRNHAQNVRIILL